VHEAWSLDPLKEAATASGTVHINPRSCN